jgi:chromosome segregation ATPase
MNLKLHCPECQQRIVVERTASDERLYCSLCGAELIFPLAAANDSAAAQAELPSAEALRQQIDAQNAELMGARAEAAFAHDAADQLREETAQLRQQLEVFRAERDGLQKKVEQAERDAQKLREAQQQFAKETGEVRTAMEAAVRERDTLAKNLTDLARIRTERDTATAELAALRNELKRVRAETSGTAQKNDQALAEARRAETEVKGLLVSLTAEMHEKLSAARQATATATATAKERDELKAQVSSLSVDRDTLRASLERALSELKDARAAHVQDSESTKTVDALLNNLHEREADLAAVKEKLREALAACAKAEAELSAAQAARTLAETEKAALKTQLATSEKAVADQTHVIAAMAEEVATGREQLHGALKERDETRRNLAEKENALAAQAQQAAQNAGRDETMAKLTAECDALRRDASAQQSAFAELNSRIGQLEEELSEAQHLAAAQTSECEQLRQQLCIANQTCDQIEARYTVLEEEFRERETELQQAVGRESRGREEAMARIAAIEAEARMASTRLWNDAARVNERVAELERHETAAHTLRLHVEAAEKTAAQARDNMLTLQGERDELARSLAQINQTVDRNGDEVRAVEMARDAAQIRAAELEAQLHETSDRLCLLEQEREQSRLELEATRAGLDRAKQHIVAVQARRDEMRDEIARLKVQLGLAPDPVC